MDPKTAIIALAQSEKLKTMINGGTIKRLGIVVRHHELGYRANAMVVWDVADDQIDQVGENDFFSHFIVCRDTYLTLGKKGKQ